MGGKGSTIVNGGRRSETSANCDGENIEQLG